MPLKRFSSIHNLKSFDTIFFQRLVIVQQEQISCCMQEIVVTKNIHVMRVKAIVVTIMIVKVVWFAEWIIATHTDFPQKERVVVKKVIN